MKKYVFSVTVDGVEEMVEIDTMNYCSAESELNRRVFATGCDRFICRLVSVNGNPNVETEILFGVMPE